MLYRRRVDVYATTQIRRNNEFLLFFLLLVSLFFFIKSSTRCSSCCHRHLPDWQFGTPSSNFYMQQLAKFAMKQKGHSSPSRLHFTGTLHYVTSNGQGKSELLTSLLSLSTQCSKGQLRLAPKQSWHQRRYLKPIVHHCRSVQFHQPAVEQKYVRKWGLDSSTFPETSASSACLLVVGLAQRRCKTAYRPGILTAGSQQHSMHFEAPRV